MFRATGTKPPPAPKELEITEVEDADGIREFERVLATAFGQPDAPSVWDERVLELSGLHFWLGCVEGSAVATSAVSVTRGVNGVQTIATLPDYRGHGYGEAMTWVATTADPMRPAVLLASDLGRPVYERMGYTALLRFTYWRIPRP
jgi:GNAT superfamily N-acetyltransferase